MSKTSELPLLESMNAQMFMTMVRRFTQMVQEDPVLEELLDGDKVDEVVDHLQRNYAGNSDAELALTWYHDPSHRSL